MTGRNGSDQLNRFLAVLAVLALVLSMILPSKIRSLFYVLFLILLVMTYYRMFSRNLYKRREENARYLQKRSQFVGNFRLLKERWIQRKDYCFFSCPSCRTTLRVPKGRGKIKIVCRKCGTSFIRKS